MDAGHCTKCQKCVVSADNLSFSCQAIADKCKACEWCDGVTGQCAPIKCADCNACDLTKNQCAPTPDVACGSDTECNKCDINGRCAALDNTTCTSVNTSVCEVAKCAAGKCTVQPNSAAANSLECAPAGQCFSQLCQADGSCKKIPKPDVACSEVKTDQCNIGKCDESGACVTVPLDNVPCTGPEEKLQDRNVTLCQDFKCVAGQCVSIPRTVGTNCTHRVNETDLTEVICVISLCDASGMCVSNTSTSLCVAKKKSKATAAIVVGVVGGTVALLAAVAVGIFVAAKASPAVAAGMGLDPAFAAGAVNPTYVQMAENFNPSYT